MRYQTIHITFPCQSHCAFSWRYIAGIPRRSNTHCDGSWFTCGLHYFHYPLSFFYKLKILSGEGYVMFSLRAKVPSHRLRSVQVIYIFNFNMKILPEGVSYFRWDVFNVSQWFLARVDPLSRAWVVWKDGDYDGFQWKHFLGWDKHYNSAVFCHKHKKPGTVQICKTKGNVKLPKTLY